MGHQSTTPVTDVFRRIIEEKFPIAEKEKAMSQNTNTADANTDKDASARANIAKLLFQAGTAAGTPQFQADLDQLTKAIDQARIKVEMPTWKETAKTAAIYGGVTAAILIVTVVAVRLIAGGGSNAPAN